MGKKLFVGGLSWGTDDQGLRAYFEQCGTVEDAKVITDRETGRSRGFGFVTFSSDDEAQNAMEQLNGTTLDGRSLNVNEAQDRRGGGGSGAYWGGFPCRPAEWRTHGVDVVRVECEYEKETSLELKMWDFAGQSVYHAGHGMFMSGDSVCVVAASLAEWPAAGRVVYWLSMVGCHAPGTPVYVVGTKADMVEEGAVAPVVAVVVEEGVLFIMLNHLQIHLS